MFFSLLVKIVIVYFFVRRVAALENKANKPVLRHQKSIPDSKKYRGLSPEDIVLAKRLEKLEEDRRKSNCFGH